MPTRYLGTTEIASRLGVGGRTVIKWIERYANTSAPFPACDAEIGHGGQTTRGWLPTRWPEIERWVSIERGAVRPQGRPRKTHTTGRGSS